MENTANRITVTGELRQLPEFSHTNHGRKFYRLLLGVERLSGTEDLLPVIAAEDTLQRAGLFSGERFCVTGQLRSCSSRLPEGRKLLIYVFAASLDTTQQPPENDVQLQGAVCKPPIFRRTPLGREICDLMLRVPRPYGRSDYIPVILWGRLAQSAAGLCAGARIRVIGRLQSREYVKQLETGPETRTAYELSAGGFEPVEEEAQNFTEYF